MATLDAQDMIREEAGTLTVCISLPIDCEAHFSVMAQQVRPALADPGNGIDPLEVTKMLRRKSSRFHQGQEPQSAPLNRPDICMQSFILCDVL